MKFNFEIDRTEQLIRIRWQGVFDLDNLNHALDGMYNDSEYRPEYDGICDTREVGFALSVDELKKHQRFIQDHPIGTSGRWAVITGRPHEQTLSIIYKDLAQEVHETKMFSSEEEALKWLRPQGVKNVEYTD